MLGFLLDGEGLSVVAPGWLGCKSLKQRVMVRDRQECFFCIEHLGPARVWVGVLGIIRRWSGEFSSFLGMIAVSMLPVVLGKVHHSKLEKLGWAGREIVRGLDWLDRVRLPDLE